MTVDPSPKAAAHRSKLERLFKRLRAPTPSAFVKNALTLVSATVVTQGVSALSAPVLARLYPPESYGLLGLVMSITGLIGVFSSFQYVRAIVIPADEEDSLGLAQLSILICLTVSLFLALPSILLRHKAAQWLNSPGLAIWLPLIPVAIAIGGVGSALNGWANKLERYRAMSRSRIWGVLAAMVVSLVAGVTAPGSWGLVAGYVTGLLATAIVLGWDSWRSDGARFLRVNRKQLLSLARRHRRFAAYSTPTEFISVFVAQAPVLLLTTFVGPAAVGLFNMTNRLLGLPNTFIAGAIGEVFQQRASADYAETGSCRPIYVKTAKALTYAGIFPTLILAIAAPTIFELYLGPKWRGAGDFARILAGLNLLRLVVGPISYVFYIAERQGEDMLAHLAMIAAIGGAMFLTYTHGGGALAVIGAYAAAYSVIYLYYGIRGYYLTVRPAGE